MHRFLVFLFAVTTCLGGRATEGWGQDNGGPQEAPAAHSPGFEGTATSFEEALLNSNGIVGNLPTIRVGYMPGDAYFSFRLTSELLKKSRLKEPLEIEYWSPHPTGVFTQEVAFWRLFVEGSDELLPRLDEVYKSLRPNGPHILLRTHRSGGDAVLIEGDGPIALAVDESFDVNDFMMGLRYNSAWTDPGKYATGKTESSPFGIKRTFPYSSLIGYSYIATDWACAEVAPELPAKPPQGVDWSKHVAPANDSTTVLASDIRILVLTTNNIHAYTTPVDQIELIEIAKDGIIRRNWSKDTDRWSGK